MQPLELPPNLPETFYRGSGRLAAFRGRPDLPDRPEDWIASCTTRFAAVDAGLSRVTPDGPLLRDVVAADPRGWLGRSDIDAPGILVKLLDAGQRLPVHLHPDRSFAGAHLHSRYGKTEAWVVLDAAPGAEVYLGFRRDVAADELSDWVVRQDIAALLGAMNRLPVAAGDVVLCPAGVPHAIGSGILLLEVQEPTDFSVLLERSGFPVSPSDAMLGLDPAIALSCATRGALGPARLAELRRPAADSLLPAEAGRFFAVDAVSDGFTGRGFAVLVVTDGAGELRGDGNATPLRRGAALAVPHGAGELTVVGGVHGYWCAPPQPAPAM